MSERLPSQEELDQLEPAQREAAFESLHLALSLSEGELRRRDAARAFAPPDVWGATAASTVIHIVESYKRGEVTVEGALAGMQRISIGARTQFRMLLLGMLAARLLQEQPPPKQRGQRQPPYPLWIRNSTAQLVRVLKDHNPSERRSPAPAYGHKSSPLIDEALAILNNIGLFEPTGAPTPGTVDTWVRALEKEEAERS